MRYLLFVMLALVLLGCKKETTPNDQIEISKAGFVYVNPQGKELPDSILIVPIDVATMPVNIKYDYYEGANFKSKIKNRTKHNQQNALFLRWVLFDLDKQKIVKTDSTSDINIVSRSIGKYRLTQYVFKSKKDSETTKLALDSASKIIEFTDLKQVEAISIDTLKLHSPFLTYDFNRDKEFEAVISLYRSRQDADNGAKPLFETQTLKSLKLGATHVTFRSAVPIFIPTFEVLTGKDGFYMQLTYIQEDKRFKILDNEFGLIFKYYKTGYLNSDKSGVNEERKLEFGDMTLTVNSSFNFMQ
ncbi:hypothetical protein [Sphingobacterium sp. SYP-B4668]|uniref:hypothetical protein n=1 Tax=Sphingobacterium sp. SYP-B4668 TaxID=2996035 RepID=UPI0022DD0C4E|nr:hypothetical protein [Sphingobacterium sp. SYP-B4668]